MGANPPEDRDSLVRLALLQERLGVLQATAEKGEMRAEAWRNEMTSSLSKVTQELSDLRQAHRGLETKVDSLSQKIEDKVGKEWFTGTWKLVAGVAVVSGAMGGILTAARALHWIP